MSYINLVYGLARHETFIAQWLEHPTGVRKIMGSIPVGEFFRFFPCPILVTCWSHQFSFLDRAWNLLSLFITSVAIVLKLQSNGYFLLITVVKVLLNLPQITTCGLPSITTLPVADIYALRLISVVIQNIHPHFRFTAPHVSMRL